MDTSEAQILLRNLIQRTEEDDRGFRLVGRLTKGEMEALELALSALGVGKEIPQREAGVITDDHETVPAHSEVQLNLRSCSAPIPEDVRICLDFGTAMSKATLVNDTGKDERIEVLPLGAEAGQKSDDYLLLSSVYIRNDGILVFGESAIDWSYQESPDGSRQRLDNIKRRLSEGGWEDALEKTYNPTTTDVTYGNMVLAYLTYLTWITNQCLRNLGYGDVVLSRRFALPALPSTEEREAATRLREAIGKSQLLADTFGADLVTGVPLDHFMSTVRSLDGEQLNYAFVDKHLSEPAGVAASMLSWTASQSSLVLIVDIGAGTSDLGLYRLHVGPAGQNSQFLEVEGSIRTLKQAGNYLDRLLIEYLLKKGGIELHDINAKGLRGRLNLRIRDYKETLFAEGSVSILEGNLEVNVEMDEFASLEQVRQFTISLKGEMTGILESIHESWLGWVRANPRRTLTVMLTGGGASLPMIQELVGETLSIGGQELRVSRALPRPMWLDDLSLPAEIEYSRVAVSLGGARRRMMDERVARLTAG